jgi:hypothetical protein
MPITKTVTLYYFNELSEEAQEKALEELWDINVDHEWWDHTYDDAKTIGLVIDEFDLDNRKKISGSLKEDFLDCCRLIRANHGKDCETFKTAHGHLKEWAKVFAIWRESELQEDADNYEGFTVSDWLYEFNESDEAAELTKDLEKDLLEDYLLMLSEEYDFLTSKEQVKGSILARANEYTFTEDGGRA